MLGVNKAKGLVAASLVAAAALGLGMSQESQAGYLYTLDNVVFSDGSTATGSFTIGEAYGFLESWNITTTNGVFAGANYAPPLNPSINNPADTAVIFYRDTPAYKGFLKMTFADSLWATPTFAQPASSALVAGYPNSFECGTWNDVNNLCTGTSRTATGRVISGAATGVPEPATLGLLGLGLAGIGLARRKRAA